MSKKADRNKGTDSLESFRHTFESTLKGIETYYRQLHNVMIEKYHRADAAYSHHDDAEKFQQEFDDDYFNQIKKLAAHLKIEIDSTKNLKKLRKNCDK